MGYHLVTSIWVTQHRVSSSRNHSDRRSDLDRALTLRERSGERRGRPAGSRPSTCDCTTEGEKEIEIDITADAQGGAMAGVASPTLSPFLVASWTFPRGQRPRVIDIARLRTSVGRRVRYSDIFPHSRDRTPRFPLVTLADISLYALRSTETFQITAIVPPEFQSPATRWPPRTEDARSGRCSNEPCNLPNEETCRWADPFAIGRSAWFRFSVARY